MQIDVIVLRRRTIHPVAVRLLATDENGTFSTLDEAGQRQSAGEAWRQLALKINRLACENQDLTVDVFLFLRGQLLENLHNPGLLKEIVEAAREYTWGSNIYIAWDRAKGMEFEQLYSCELNRLVLKDWFNLLLEFGITALIEIPGQVRAKEPDLFKILHAAMLESTDKRDRLRRLVRQDGWRLIVHDAVHFLNEFIKLFVTSELHFPKGNNRAIFYERRPKRGWKQLLEQLPDSFNGALFVAARPCRGVKDLEGLLEQYTPGQRLFRFNGTFEWLYAFIRLIKAGAGPAPAPAPVPQRDEIVWVEPAERTLFTQAAADNDLCLLVTSSFYFSPEQTPEPDDDSAEAREARQCLAASQEIGGILRNLPFHVDVEVHHGVICEHFPKRLKPRTFTAWLHLSHGSRRGLYDEMIRQDASPQRWRENFNAYKRRSLQLVIFSACESAAVARLLAEAGVRVAIGFNDKVTPDAARELSVRVIPAALCAGERRDAILHAFGEAVDMLRSISHLEEGRDENYGTSEPRAFAVKRETS